jgi:hypothetical protein
MGKGSRVVARVLPVRILAVLPVGTDREHAWHMERRCYWAVQTDMGGLTLPVVNGWIPGDVVYRRLHTMFPEVFYPGAPGLVTPDDAVSGDDLRLLAYRATEPTYRLVC